MPPDEFQEAHDNAEDYVLESYIASKRVIDAYKDSIDLDKVFSASLALAIRESALAKSVPPEWYVTCLLPVIASLMGRVSVVAIPSRHYKQAVIAYGLVLGPTGVTKTGVLDEVFYPLMMLDEEFREEYKQKKQEYEDAEDKSELEKPVEHWFYADAATVEALGTKFNPAGGFVQRVDEAEHFFRSLGAYKSSKSQGADALYVNNLWNGTSAVSLRVQDPRVLKNPRINLIVFGHPDATPKAMHEAIGDRHGTDTRGFKARFLMTLKPATLGELTLEAPKADLVEILHRLYGALARNRVGWPLGNNPYDDVRCFLLSVEAQLKLCQFRRVRNKIMQETNEEAIQAIWPKAESYAIRIAGILHVIYHILAGTEPTRIPHSIPVETFDAAVHLAVYFARQSEAVFHLNQTGERDPVAAKVLASLQRKGPIGAKVRDVQGTLSGSGLDSKAILAALLSLVEDGEVVEIERRFYINDPAIVGSVGAMLGDTPTPENKSTKAFEPDVGDVGDIEDFPDITADDVTDVSDWPVGESFDPVLPQHPNNGVESQLGLGVDQLETIPTTAQQSQHAPAKQFEAFEV
jgi:hypothetical protein